MERFRLTYEDPEHEDEGFAVAQDALNRGMEQRAQGLAVAVFDDSVDPPYCVASYAALKPDGSPL